MKKLIISALVLLPTITFAANINNVSDLITLALDYGNTFVRIIIALAVIYIVWGVFKYLIKGADNDDARKEGGKVILYGVIGLFVILSIWGLVNILKSSFRTSNNTPTEDFPKVGEGINVPR